MMMTKKFKILGKYIKDLSSETKDLETYLFVKDNISKYKNGCFCTIDSNNYNDLNNNLVSLNNPNLLLRPHKDKFSLQYFLHNNLKK